MRGLYEDFILYNVFCYPNEQRIENEKVKASKNPKFYSKGYEIVDTQLASTTSILKYFVYEKIRFRNKYMYLE